MVDDFSDAISNFIAVIREIVFVIFSETTGVNCKGVEIGSIMSPCMTLKKLC